MAKFYIESNGFRVIYSMEKEQTFVSCLLRFLKDLHNRFGSYTRMGVSIAICEAGFPSDLKNPLISSFIPIEERNARKDSSTVVKSFSSEYIKDRLSRYSPGDIVFVHSAAAIEYAKCVFPEL